MAFVLTYDTIVSQLVNYFQRRDEDFLNAIPVFCTLSNNRIASVLNSLGLDLYASFQFTVSSNIIQKPTDWRRSISLTLTDSNNNIYVIQKRNFEYIQLYQGNSITQGTPKYYGDVDYFNLIVTPIPDQQYNALLSYIATLLPLDSNNQSNWATTFAPDLYFASLMYDAVLWTKNMEQLPLIKNNYDMSLQSYEKENLERKYDRTSKGSLA